MHETQQAVCNDKERKEKVIIVDDVRGDSVRTPGGGGAPGAPGQPRQPRPRA